MKEIACFDTVPYEDVAEYERYKKIGRGFKVLRTAFDWYFFFLKVSSGAGATPSASDMEWRKLKSVVMAYRLKVPLKCLGGCCVSLPVLDSPDLTVDQKLAWLNGFGDSGGKKKFNLNAWKDCRKHNRISQMLPEDLYQDLLLAMASWTYHDGSPLEDDPSAWDAVMRLDFSGALAVAGVGVSYDDEEMA